METFYRAIILVTHIIQKSTISFHWCLSSSTWIATWGLNAFVFQVVRTQLFHFVCSFLCFIHVISRLSNTKKMIFSKIVISFNGKKIMAIKMGTIRDKKEKNVKIESRQYWSGDKVQKSIISNGIRSLSGCVCVHYLQTHRDQCWKFSCLRRFCMAQIPYRCVVSTKVLTKIRILRSISIKRTLKRKIAFNCRIGIRKKVKLRQPTSRMHAKLVKTYRKCRLNK